MVMITVVIITCAGGTRTKDSHELVLARQSIVTHAKAFQLDAIDLVDIDYKGGRHQWLGSKVDGAWCTVPTACSLAESESESTIIATECVSSILYCRTNTSCSVLLVLKYIVQNSEHLI